MRLKSDKRAVEEIPLRLMIVAVVAAMSVLPAAQALETLRTRDFVVRASQQLDEIIRTADVLSVEGPGSVRTLHLDFASSGRVGLESFEMGGALEGPNSTSVILKLSNGGVLVRSTSSEDATICAKDSAGLRTSAVRFDLRLSAQYEKGRFCILAEVI